MWHDLSDGLVLSPWKSPKDDKMVMVYEQSMLPRGLRGLGE